MKFALLIYQNWKWIEEGISESELAEGRQDDHVRGHCRRA